MTHSFSCYDHLHLSVTIRLCAGNAFFLPFYYYALNLPRNAQADCSLILSNPAFFPVLYHVSSSGRSSLLSFTIGFIFHEILTLGISKRISYCILR